MKLSSQVECAMVALTQLARAPRDTVASIGTLAEALQIPRPFLEKTLLALKHAGYVESKMGKRGGFRLARPPSEIRLADVVRLFGRPIAPTRCVSKFFFQLTPLARDIGLTQFFKSIRDYSAMRMETTTVADVIRTKSTADGIYVDNAATSFPLESAPMRSRMESRMEDKMLTIGDRVFALDEFGCLQNFYDWQPEFAEGMAEQVGIAPPLTEAHNKFISYLRETVIKTGRTPIVHRACRDNGLKLWELERLFPAGYHRGACKLAGLNYYNRHITREPHADKIYRINTRGFLVDASEWDETFAAMRAEELGTALTGQHWQVIRFLRAAYSTNGKVPTVFEVCRGCNLDGEDLERLFPSGYQRGAVKIAGLTISP